VSALPDVDGLLLDIDGVLSVSWEPVPGSIEAMRWIGEHGPPFRLITNTTTHTRADLAATLRAAGFDIDGDQIVTAVVATAAHLRSHHPGTPAFVLSDGDAKEDLEGIELVSADAADVIVIGGACDAFTYATLNTVFQRLMQGAVLVGMHRNLYWRTERGWELDAGAYIAGLEEAAGTKATICGKPAPAYFGSALALMGVAPDRALMVGDDIENDVMGAQAAGIPGVLVRTGKFRESDLAKGEPDHVIEALADLPRLLGG
jgi:HAD superfamily hydrolase (TIGR01458 family)